MTKKCPKCGTEKPSDEFYEDTSRASGLSSWCKICVCTRIRNPEKTKASTKAYYASHREEKRAYGRAYNAAHREEKKAYDVAYRAANPEKMLAGDRRRKYGLPPEAFQLMLLTQKNACGVCKEIFSKEPHVDHCHDTGKIRGLLCRNCNIAMGLLKDSPATLRRAAEYLEGKSCLKPADVVKE